MRFSEEKKKKEKLDLRQTIIRKFIEASKQFVYFGKEFSCFWYMSARNYICMYVLSINHLSIYLSYLSLQCILGLFVKGCTPGLEL